MSQASSYITIFLSSINPLARLKEKIDRYLQKKKTKERIIRALADEIQEYLDILERSLKISKTEVVSKVKSIDGIPTTPQINIILNGFSEVMLKYSELIRAFIKLSKACCEVIENQAFMENLKETDSLLYDFVNLMSNIYVKEGKVKINGRYYRFFKLYEDELFDKVKINEVEEIIKGIREFADKILFWVKKKRRQISGGIIRKYRRNLKALYAASKDVIVADIEVSKLRVYVPTKFLPIAILLEEYSELFH